MVTDFGMSDKLGPRTFGDKQELVFLGREISEQKDYSDKTANLIDEEINKIIRSVFGVAKRILAENKARLIHIAGRLITKETLEGEELEALFKEAVPSPASKATTAS
jgi:cell division protease FtsH